MKSILHLPLKINIKTELAFSIQILIYTHKKMNKRIIQCLMLVAITSMMWGCYPEGPTSYDQFDVVYTNYQKDYNFKGKKFYTMPDSIVKITGNLSAGKPIVFVSAAYANPVLNRIKTNMTNLGYTWVSTADSAQADYAILCAAIEVENYSYTYYYDYWYGWYYPYYGGGWYYPYGTVTSYTTGTLSMNMIDRESFSPTDKNGVVWISLINGLLEGSSTNYTSRINKSIDQAFTQSQYLHQ